MGPDDAAAGILQGECHVVILSLSVFELLPIAIITGHVALNPYNKVEESFGLQATHDLLFHQMDLSAYDHHMFPGVVPRTFLGPLLLAGCSSPLVACLSLTGATKLAALYVVRLVLGLLSACGVVAVMRATRRQYGYDAFRALALLSACQFHYPFYASRTLPNTFASLLVLPATAAWIDGDVRRVIRLLTIAVVIFRAELVLLLGPLALLFLGTSRISVTELLRLGFGSAFVALALTVAVDSVLWRRPLYPEGEVLWFNTILNKSSEYGTAPWHWYFSSALPRAMLLSYPLALLSPVVVGQRIRELVAMPVLFIALYSILPHKELRFVLYALPPLNVAAAVAAARLYRKLPEDDEKATKETRMLAIFGRIGTVLMLVVRRVVPVSHGSGAELPGSPRAAPAACPRRRRHQPRQPRARAHWRGRGRKWREPVPRARWRVALLEGGGPRAVHGPAAADRSRHRRKAPVFVRPREAGREAAGLHAGTRADGLRPNLDQASLFPLRAQGGSAQAPVRAGR